MIQIESIEAVENIDELLQLENLDGVMIGPYDISWIIRSAWTTGSSFGN